jgi:thiosulfate dehydrogenase [quinone] large subunit
VARAPARRAPYRQAPPASPAGAANLLLDRDVWLLLPLRAFLGITFVYAGLQKLADRWFFRGGAPSSLQSQLHGAARTSPVGGLLATPAHHAVLFGLLIAFGELAVGVGTLLGLWARAAAVGGMVLSLAFLLAVSWHSRPYYYGADVVFLFAWTPLAIAGAGRISVDALAATRARADVGLRPPQPVTLEFAAVQRLCGYHDAGRCTAQHGRRCGPAGCPVLKASDPPARTTAELDRRTLLTRAGWAGWVAAGTVLAGGFVALAGRVVPPRPKRVATASLSTGTPPGTGTPTTTAGTAGSGAPTSGAPPASSAATEAPAAAPPTTGAPAPASPPPPTAPPTTRAIAGTRIGPAAAVPVGGAASFTDPRTGDPAYALQPVRGRFLAFDATCTHNGCPVQYTGAEFQCPCHGAAFDSSTGAVVQGPARRPLRAIPVQLGPDGQLYVQ